MYELLPRRFQRENSPRKFKNENSKKKVLVLDYFILKILVWNIPIFDPKVVLKGS